MIKKSIVAASIVLLLCSNAMAGLGSMYASQYSRDRGTVVGAVEIEGKGIYNLIISVDVMRRPQDKKIFKSDEYEFLMERFSVTWQGVALQRILEAKTLKVSDLAALKKTVESELDKLAVTLKNKLLPEQNAEIVFAVSSFFLLEPRDN